MAFYSVKPKAWPGRRTRPASTDDPYKPGSDNFAERNRQTIREMPDGLTRVDIGEPIP